MKMFVPLALLFATLLFSCAGPGGSQGTGLQPGQVVGVSGTPGKSLFVGKVALQSSGAKAAGGKAAGTTDTVSSIGYVSGDGTVTPVTFADSLGNLLVLKTTFVKQLGPTALAVQFSEIKIVQVTASGVADDQTFAISGQCLIDFASGKVYSLEGYRIADSLYADGQIYIVQEPSTVYRIDPANTGLAIPMNNPTYDPMNGIEFVLGTKLIVGSHSLDIAGHFPPKTIASATVDLWPTAGGVSVGGNNSAVFFDGLGQLWGILVGTSTISWYRMTIDDNGHTQIPRIDGVQDFHEFTVAGTMAFPHIGNSQLGFTSNLTTNLRSTQPIVIFGSDAYGHGSSVIVSAAAAGGLDFTSSANEYTLSDAPMASGIDKVLLEGSLYWISSVDAKLYRMNLQTGVQTLAYQSDQLVYLKTGSTPLLVGSGDHLIFYQYNGATEVDSYSWSPDSGVAPVQIASYPMNIETLVELTF